MQRSAPAVSVLRSAALFFVHAVSVLMAWLSVPPRLSI